MNRRGFFGLVAAAFCAKVAPDPDDNIVVLRSGVKATHIFKGEGSAWTEYDDYDDLMLIESLEHAHGQL
jgi:hypothetical protein